MNAGCVICFMEIKYEKSENCRLELQFAKQSGVPVVPVKFAADYSASGWLGIITAGSLWVPLHDNKDFALGISQLVQQIELAAPTTILALPAGGQPSPDRPAVAVDGERAGGRQDGGGEEEEVSP